MPRITNAYSNSPLKLVQNSPGFCPLEGLITEWIAYLKPDCTKATIRNNLEKAGKFRWWWLNYHAGDGAHPENVTVTHAREFAAYLKTEAINRWGVEPNAKRPSKPILAPDSITSYGRVVKAFFNWLEAENKIESSPFNHKSVQFRRKHDVNRILKTVEVTDLAKIFKHLASDTSFPGLRNMALIALLLDSGIRRGELINLKVRDLELTHSRCKVTGKTGTRYAHFSSLCKNALENYLRNPFFQSYATTMPLWVTIDGTPLSYETITHIFRRLRKATGVAVHAHALRHTFASMLADNGADAFVLKELLGHESVVTTEQYVKLSRSTLAAMQKSGSPLNAVNRISPVGSKKRGRPSGSNKDR